ncbi:hypothetical protein [Candidatus Marithrix sp. Canyon 246]|nr:hypothetical protein [Candidatus Marithrix sp. Canyon 246]
MDEYFRSLAKNNFAQAWKLGVSTYAYAKIERCETNVGHDRLRQIAEVG